MKVGTNFQITILLILDLFLNTRIATRKKYKLL